MSRRHVDILHVIGSFVAAGAERFVVDLTLALKEAGHDVGVVALSAKTDDVGRGMRAALERAGVLNLAGPTDRVGARSAWWYAQGLFALRPNVVHLHTPNTDLAHYLARVIWRRPHDLFRTLHNTNIPESRRYWHALKRNPVNASIACSAAVRTAMQERIRGPIDVIQNGIAFDWPVRDEATRRERAARLGLTGDRRHFLSVGRMGGRSPESAAKAHDVLLRAWRDGALGAAGGILHVLGDGELRGALERLAEGDDSIVFHGVQSGIDDWLIGCDYFVMPSRHEGLPIAGIEALGTGLPCIFSTIEPLKELGAKAVRWVTVDDAAGLAQQLRAAAAADREYPIEEARRVRDAYSMAGVARRYVACYRAHGHKIEHCGLVQ